MLVQSRDIRQFKCLFSAKLIFVVICAKAYIVLLYRKASLALVRKMIHYTSPTLLSDVCTAEGSNFTQVLVEVLAAVLDHEVSVQCQLA